MNYIDYFWSYVSTSVNNALSVLNTIYMNPQAKPFYDLLIIVFATGVIIKFVLAPIFGSFFVGSDEAESKESIEAKQRKVNRDEYYKAKTAYYKQRTKK